MASATQLLQSAGLNVTTTDRFVASNMNGAQVLFTGLVDVPFTAQELADIPAFVSAGGGLIVTRDILGWGDSVDPLAAAFGVIYSSAVSGSSTPADVQSSASHPIWSGPAGSATRFGQVASCSVASGATIIGTHVTDGKAALGVLSYGAGTVVFLTDMSPFSDYGYSPPPTASNDPGIVWQNMIAFLIAGNGPSGTPYCFGDTTGASCPCSAFGASGQGCANTSGVGGATLEGQGAALLAFDSFRLDVAGVPGAKPGLILRGDNQVSVPAGDGILCTAGGSMRSQVHVTIAGVTSFTDFNGSPFGAVANLGAPTNFQFWYRDPGNPCSGAGFNFTNGVSVVYQP